MLDINKIKNYPYSLNNKADKVQINDIHYTSIVILTYNQLEYTRLCIESIRKFTPKGRYELIIIDNNSTDETVSWLNSQDDLIVIMNDKNYGVPKGYNQGIKEANGENILLLNNDVIVTPNWLHNLDLALWSDSQIGAVSCLSNYVSNAQRIEVDYDDITSMLDFSKVFNVSDKSKYELRGRLIGFCLLIK
ncbi:MAG: glycosyltransferase family 2 protein, partial [Peptostreptococcaceae bacterium]